MKNEMVLWISQRSFDIVFHSLSSCYTRKMLYIHFTIRTYFFDSFQAFRRFIMLSIKIATFPVVFFSCAFLSSFSVFLFLFMFSVEFWLTVSFSFFFFVDVGFTGKSLRKIFICRFVFPLYLYFTVCGDTVFLFIAGRLFCNNTSLRLASSTFGLIKSQWLYLYFLFAL